MTTAWEIATAGVHHQVRQLQERKDEEKAERLRPDLSELDEDELMEMIKVPWFSYC